MGRAEFHKSVKAGYIPYESMYDIQLYGLMG